MYKVVIGLEVHCELNTISKAFSGARNEYSYEPNTNLSVIDLGFPGIMPETNKEAVKKALKMALALQCEIPDKLIFDRKNYYYPDLTKGYQITQATNPMGKNGYVMINVNDYDKKVLIHDIHLEEDTASLEHMNNYTLIDYNRSGVPLVEIVTEPCLESANEAYAYLENLKQIFLYTDCSSAKGELGQMRCDVNISLMKEDAKEFGTKVEIKNINSFNSVKEAIEYEIKRQTELLESGNVIIQETRRFSDDTKTTISMRQKVEAVDYKYYIEPNLPPIKISNSYLEEIKREIPILPFDLINNLISQYSLSRKDANYLVKNKKNVEYFNKCISLGANPKSVVNWISGSLMAYINKNGYEIDDIFMTPKMLVSLITMIDDGKISSKQAKEVLAVSLETNKDPLLVIKENKMEQLQDDNLIRDIIISSIDDKQELVGEYKKGRNVTDYFVGQVMKQTKGQANPTLTRNIVIEELNKL